MSGTLSKMLIGLHVQCRLLLSGFDRNRNFVDGISKNTQISNFMKIRPEGVELFRADRQTDRNNEANNRFSQYLRTRLRTSFSPHSVSSYLTVNTPPFQSIDRLLSAVC